MEFEWDEGKAATNLAKHGVSFDAVLVLNWADALVVQDDRFDYGEERFIAYARRLDGIGYVVAFTLRGRTRRIISMRPFGRREIRIYGP
jgi:uncharacterized protein